MSIPKIIHYIWLGPEKRPRVVKECIKTWKEIIPDYEIMLWNECNMPKHPYVELALKNKRYAFASDYIRCWALYEYGGIYLDTDMYILKSLDSLLSCDFFIGKENSDEISAGIIGSIRNHLFVKKLIKEYDKKGSATNYQEEPIPQIITRLYNQTKPAITIFEPDYFYPFPYTESMERINHFRSYIKPNSYAVHLWNASWMPEIASNRQKYNSMFWRTYRNLLKLLKK